MWLVNIEQSFLRFTTAQVVRPTLSPGVNFNPLASNPLSKLFLFSSSFFRNLLFRRFPFEGVYRYPYATHREDFISNWVAQVNKASKVTYFKNFCSKPAKFQVNAKSKSPVFIHYKVALPLQTAQHSLLENILKNIAHSCCRILSNMKIY